MKYVHVYAFFLMLFFHTSYAQNQTNVPKDNIKTPAQEGSKIILQNQF